MNDKNSKTNQANNSESTNPVDSITKPNELSDEVYTLDLNSKDQLAKFIVLKINKRRKSALQLILITLSLGVLLFYYYADFNFARITTDLGILLGSFIFLWILVVNFLSFIINQKNLKKLSRSYYGFSYLIYVAPYRVFGIFEAGFSIVGALTLLNPLAWIINPAGQSNRFIRTSESAAYSYMSFKVAEQSDEFQIVLKRYFDILDYENYQRIVTENLKQQHNNV